MTRRTRALLMKELADIRSNPSVFVPAIITGAISILLPFVVALVIPAVTGERLSDTGDLALATEIYRDQPGLRGVDPEGAVQAWVFQQFVILLVLTPVAGAMSIAAYAVVGEKQARTLEPLLATPITTFELLLGKVLGALLPGMALTVACFLAYLVGAFVFANPGVYRIVLVPRTLAVLFALGPMAALAALQLAICVSSRVNDPRSAQQIGALIILPISALLVAQLSGAVLLTTPAVLLIALALAVINAGLMRLAVTLFDRESILTRWR